MTQKRLALYKEMGLLLQFDFPTIGEGEKDHIYLDEIIVYYSLN